MEPLVTTTQPTMLADLVAAAARQTMRRRRVRPEAEVERCAADVPQPRDFAAALSEPGLAVIAETKPRSPLKGPLTECYRPAALAHACQCGGAAAVSVLTHEGFGGSPEDLAIVRAEADLPILCKDFVVEEYQVLEARSLGADAVLLIVAALGTERLAQLLGCARRLGMDVLVEVHDADEVEVVLLVGAQVIGVNHRNLRSFEIDMTLSARLRDRIGDHRLMVAESGVSGAADARRLRDVGADAILVGEMLMRAHAPEKAARELRLA
jgi:indole-3-glycerol phosphate synthase